MKNKARNYQSILNKNSKLSMSLKNKFEIINELEK